MGAKASDRLDSVGLMPGDQAHKPRVIHPRAPDRSGTSPVSQRPLRRQDESPDALFYRSPRFVTHIDDGAIAAVTQVYREFLPADGSILDLMSSWVSHLPDEVNYPRVIGLGMNAAELAANPRLESFVVHDLNAEPTLPFAPGEFSAATLCVSIDYLTQPLLPHQGRRRVADEQRHGAQTPGGRLAHPIRPLGLYRDSRPRPAPAPGRPALRGDRPEPWPWGMKTSQITHRKRVAEGQKSLQIAGLQIANLARRLPLRSAISPLLRFAMLRFAIPGHSGLGASVRNGTAGSPAALTRLHAGLSAQA